MSRPLTREIMRTALTTLNHIFPRWKLGDEQFTNLVEAYGSALKDFDAETVEGAVGLAMKTEQRWPPAAKLRELAGEWLRRNRPELTKALRSGHTPDGCPTCGSLPRWAVLDCVDRQTGLSREVERRIMPCISSRHAAGTNYTPYPANFLRWGSEPLPKEPVYEQAPADPGSHRGDGHQHSLGDADVDSKGDHPPAQEYPDAGAQAGGGAG